MELQDTESAVPKGLHLPCRNSFDGDNASYWSYPFNKLYKRVGCANITLGTDSVGNLLQTGAYSRRFK